MIKASELMVGNWLYSELTKCEFQATAQDILNISIDNFVVSPIPLTPEILEKAGFELNLKEWHKEGWLPYLVERKLHSHDGIWYQVFNVADCSLIYLHQLQNLYFALTGEELNIKF